ncbi:MAG: hypothetical protein AMXMBFR13_03590 [Phycisphaerae bacterium]
MSKLALAGTLAVMTFWVQAHFAGDHAAEQPDPTRSAEKLNQRAAGFSPRGRSHTENGTSPFAWLHLVSEAMPTTDGAPAPDATTSTDAILMTPASLSLRFVAVDIFIDSGDKPLAAYQFEFTAQSPERRRGGVQSPERKRGGITGPTIRADPTDRALPTDRADATAPSDPTDQSDLLIGTSIEQEISTAQAVDSDSAGLSTGQAPTTTLPRSTGGGKKTPPLGAGIGAEQPAAPADLNRAALGPLNSPGVKIVGVEGGEHTAFREPPYYDPAALSRNRIIIAAFNTGRDLPRGKTRVARLHLAITGPEPEYTAKLDIAASAEGAAIPATISEEPGVTE